MNVKGWIPYMGNFKFGSLGMETILLKVRVTYIFTDEILN